MITTRLICCEWILCVFFIVVRAQAFERILELRSLVSEFRGSCLREIYSLQYWLSLILLFEF